MGVTRAQTRIAASLMINLSTFSSMSLIVIPSVGSSYCVRNGFQPRVNVGESFTV